MLSIAQLKLTSQMVYCLPGFFSERLCLIYFPISFLGGLPASICHFFNPSIRPSICLSVHRAQYFRNCTSRDHYFHSTMTKNSVRQTPYPRNHTSYDCHLWYTCVKWYLHDFFSFFQNFDFLGGRAKKGGKGRAKNAPKWQNILSVVGISGTIHHMIVICGTPV